MPLWISIFTISSGLFTMIILHQSLGPMEIILSLTLLLIFLIFIPASSPEFSLTGTLTADLSSLNFLYLTLVIMMISFIASHLYLYNKQSKKFQNLLLLLTLVLFLFFIFKNYFIFYTMFELSVIPIFWIIIGWGYQTERIAASLALMFYTITASLPLLFSLLFLSHLKASGNFTLLDLTNYYSSPISNITSMLLLTAFLVKLPMFLVHFWLPKAHVEAPVMGSMILAAILLKMGGYGVIRLLPLVGKQPFSHLVFSLSAIGAAIISMLCLRLTDMKVIIAYSSVAHMGMVIATLSTTVISSLNAGVLLMLTHGFSSSAMFYGANLLYQHSHTRSIVLNKGHLAKAPAFSALWLLVMMGSMAAPPMSSFVAEVSCLIVLINQSMTLIAPLIIMIMASGAYCLILYSSSQQGSPLTFSTNMLKMSSIETMILNFHVFWMLALILNLNVT